MKPETALIKPMTASAYEIRLIQAIRALRELRKLPQRAMSAHLCMTESNYSKIENAYRPITVGQLKTIANALDVSVFLILALAESDRLVENRIVPLSEIILKFVEKVREEGNLLSDEQVNALLDRINEPWQ